MSAIERLRIDRDSPEPPFEQLRVHIIGLIRDGELLAGQKLPPVRALAQTLGIAANTVARTYRELESAGILETRGRKGTFVADSGDQSRLRAQHAVVEFVGTARGLGFDDAAIRALVDAALG